MAQFIGANVEQLRQLAVAMERSSERLSTAASSLRSLPRHIWLGMDAQRFYADLDSDLINQVNQVALALNTVGSTLRRNAAAQEQTSATLEGGGSGTPSIRTESGGSELSQGGLVGDSGVDVVAIAEVVRDGGEYLLDGTELVYNLAAKFGKNLPGADVLEMGQDTISIAEIGEALVAGKYDQAAWETAKFGVGKIPGVAGKAGEIGLDVFEMYVPVTEERQRAVLDSYAQRTYGTTDLSSEQAKQVSDRYSGIQGPLNMAYDSLIEASENPKTPVSKAIKVVGEKVADFIWGIWGPKGKN